MTAQTAERIFYKSKKAQELRTEPLEDYFLLTGLERPFTCTRTSNWRGYVGTWEFSQDRLYLTDLVGEDANGNNAHVETIFPGYPIVFAHWYTGTLTIPQGNLLGYADNGFTRIYAHDLLIDIEQGVVQGTRTRENEMSC